MKVVTNMLLLGLGFNATTLANLIQELLQALAKVNPDRNTEWPENRPDHNYVRHFVERHNLVYRAAMELCNSRAAVSEEDIKLWFKDLADSLVNNPEYADCFLDPRRIFNLVRGSFKNLWFL